MVLLNEWDVTAESGSRAGEGGPGGSRGDPRGTPCPDGVPAMQL